MDSARSSFRLEPTRQSATSQEGAKFTKFDRDDTCLSSVVADFAFENLGFSSSIPRLDFQTKHTVEIPSNAVPERSNYLTRPLETIISAQDLQHGHDAKFVLPVLSNSTYNYSTDSKPQNRSDQILQVCMKYA
jgi:hypothetical protein